MIGTALKFSEWNIYPEIFDLFSNESGWYIIVDFNLVSTDRDQIAVL